MTKQLQLYINNAIAADYARRKAASPVSAQVLRGFPSVGYHDVTLAAAAMMLADALRQSTTLAKQHSSGTKLAYKGLALQIERRLAVNKAAADSAYAARGLDALFRRWAADRE
jgi:hypothetical protein